MYHYYKQCQSCGMPLKNGDRAGSELDGSKSRMYCDICYKDGYFVQDLSLDEMKHNVNNILKQKGWLMPLRWVAIWQIPSLKRWK